MQASAGSWTLSFGCARNGAVVTEETTLNGFGLIADNALSGTNAALEARWLGLALSYFFM